MNEQKRVSFKVAQAIKEAGYPQYNTNVLDGYDILGKPTTIYSSAEKCEYIAPTYLDVWLWLWREKNYRIEIVVDHSTDKAYPIINNHNDLIFDSEENPEEVIESAINYLVDNDLIK